VAAIDISDETRDFVEFPAQVRYRAALAATGQAVRLTQQWTRGGGQHVWTITSDGTQTWATSDADTICLDTYRGMGRFLYTYGPFNA
jgi:hypothetical protein